MLVFFKNLFLSCFVFSTLSISNANALISDGSDGAFILNDELTLNVADGQVFNFTTFDVGFTGKLNLISHTPNNSFSILVGGDINIDGLVNIYTNTSFETGGNISITGKINLINNSSLTLTSEQINFLGDLLIDGLPLIYDNSDDVTVKDFPPKSFISSVPEPETYALLCLGMAMINLTRGKALKGHEK